MSAAGMALSTIDLVVIAIYLIGITAFGVWVGFRRNASSDQYFLAGHSLSWLTVGAAVFTSNISTIHLVGLAAGGAKDGLVIGNFEWMACATLILLALVFTPFYLRSGVKTLPEFMERRYSPAARTFLAIIGIIGALLIHIGISLFAAAKVFEGFLGIPMAWSIIGLSVFTVIYTALGGLKAVVLTENVQAVLLILGAALVTGMAIAALPAAGVHSYTEFRAVAQGSRLSMLQPVVGPGGALNEFSWLAVLLGYPILGIWYWCADQTLVQRVLAARTVQDGQNGALFAGFLKITPVFLMVLPGLVGYVLFQQGALDLGTEQDVDYNAVLPALINQLVPAGLKGLLAAGMAAALMSTIASGLNSCATLVSFDIVRRRYPQLPDRQVVRIGRITTGFVMLLAMLWSTQGGQFGTIFEAINKIPMTFAPAVTTVLLLGLLWPRGNAAGALATLSIGSALGTCYFVIDLPVMGQWLPGIEPSPSFRGLISDHHQGLGLPFMLVGPMIALVCVVIFVTVSLATPAMDATRVSQLAWSNPLSPVRGPLKGPADPRVVAAVLIAVVAVLYFLLR